MKISIRFQVLGFAALAVALMMGFAAISLAKQRQMSALVGRLVVVNEILSRHQTMDMMHDAIRGDVLRLELADTPEKLAEAQAECDDHEQQFREQLAKNLAAVSEPEVMAALAAAKDDAFAYADSARNLYAMAKRDRAAALLELPKFQQAFEVAEEKLGAVTDQLVQCLKQLGDQRLTMQRDGQWLVGACALVSIAIMLVVTFMLTNRIVKPIKTMQQALQRMATGDWSTGATVASRDEIGEMAQALEKMRGTVCELISGVSQRADRLTSTAGNLAGTSGTLSREAQTTAAQAGMASSSASSVSTSLDTVASAATELSQSIQEISSQTSEAARVATLAVQEASEAGTAIGRLGTSSREIGQVVNTITEIAEQTNLLALNASIEAAGAGEAGRGFAVVAGEVKNLARQTAQATDDIAKRVAAIQADATRSVETIGRISTIIEKINQATQTIASAVEQQSATTGEINRTVQDAAKGGADIATAVTTVATAADSANTAARHVDTDATALTAMAKELRDIISKMSV